MAARQRRRRRRQKAPTRGYGRRNGNMFRYTPLDRPSVLSASADMHEYNLAGTLLWCSAISTAEYCRDLPEAWIVSRVWFPCAFKTPVDTQY